MTDPTTVIAARVPLDLRKRIVKHAADRKQSLGELVRETLAHAFPAPADRSTDQ
jgi:predicted HicB family RNase H-like nuclease